MLPILLLFVFWLALQGKLGTYGGFVTSGPGIPLITNPIPTISRALGGTGAPNPGAANPAINPGHVSPPPGSGPLDWLWNRLGMGPPAPAVQSAPGPTQTSPL
jgi:hypothetical protein